MPKSRSLNIPPLFVPAKKSSKLNPPAPLETGRRFARGRTREEARFTAPPSLAGLPDTYGATFEEIKSYLRSARVRAVLAANPIVIEAYWHTGKIILSGQQEAAWGAKVIDRLSAYLDLAEDMALRQIPMTMQDWETRLNCFVAATDREVLQDAGKVTAEIAQAHAKAEFEKHRGLQDRAFESDFDQMIKQLPNPEDLP